MKEEANFTPTLKTLLEKRFADFISPLESFIHKQTTASIFLIFFSIFAIVLANTPWNHFLQQISHGNLGIVIGKQQFSLPLGEWISHGLMALFFFLTGLEIKREILAGKLKHFSEVSMIFLAAFGGIIVPAFLYYLINKQGAGQHGWGIPTATDTAFAIGILALMASRVSTGVAVFLTALAIFDDIGAILVISIFYANDLNIYALAFSAIITLCLFTANLLGIRNGWVYCVLGLLLWFFVYDAGIHPTFAGLVLAMTIPARPTINQSGFIHNIESLISRLKQRQKVYKSMLASSGQHSIVSDIGKNVQAASTPLQMWESKMITPIAIIVLPLFALFNAGFSINRELLFQGMTSPVTLGIIVGLVIGKPLGILLFTYIGLKMKIGRLPEGVELRDVPGVSVLAGIGFTMSVFFTTLSFPSELELQELAKLGILISSIISAIIGSIWIYFASVFKKQHKQKVM